jgi:hypothetical protein
MPSLAPIVFRPRSDPRRPDLLDRMMDLHGCTLAEAIERLARLAGLLPTTGS